MYIDTHTHLHHNRFDKDRREVIEQMKEAGVNYVIENPIDYESNWIMKEKLKEFDNVSFVTGIHPTRVFEAKEEWMDEIQKFAMEETTVAIGEAGLDYHISGTEHTWDNQKIWFQKFIDLAEELKKPLVLHIRDAFDDALEILKKNKGKYQGVVHCFNGNKYQAEEFLKIGLYLGIGGAITRDNPELKEALVYIPIDRIILETDCPFVTPKPYSGRNHPSYIPYIASILANQKGIRVDEVEKITTENTKHLFKITTTEEE